MKKKKLLPTFMNFSFWTENWTLEETLKRSEQWVFPRCFSITWAYTFSKVLKKVGLTQKTHLANRCHSIVAVSKQMVIFMICVFQCLAAFYRTFVFNYRSCSCWICMLPDHELLQAVCIMCSIIIAGKLLS